MIIQEALNNAIKKLKNKSTSPQLDAEVLLAFVLKKDKTYLHTNPKKNLLRNYLRNYQELIQKRSEGWPVAYLTGHKEFYGLDFLVTKDVLIPRPETEGLVGISLEAIKDLGFRIKDKKISILDVGTGSGAIIVSLAHNLNPKSYNLLASDVSAKALNVARQNACRHKVKINFKQGRLLTPWKNQGFDIIVANLPYLPKLTDASTKFEPKNALVAKNQGLALFEKLFKQVPSLRSSPSSLFLEIGHNQGRQIKKLARKFLPAFEIKILKDLSGRDRYAVLSR